MPRQGFADWCVGVRLSGAGIARHHTFPSPRLAIHLLTPFFSSHPRYRSVCGGSITVEPGLSTSQRSILLLPVFPFSLPNLTVAEPFQGWAPLTTGSEQAVRVPVRPRSTASPQCPQVQTPCFIKLRVFLPSLAWSGFTFQARSALSTAVLCATGVADGVWYELSQASMYCN